jgi:thiamine biosynthesis lipoprotein
MQLDLGGIAKGYILQEALKVLKGRGLGASMVEAGGDVAVGDAPPGRGGWAIEVLGADPAFAARAGNLVNAAIATSGGSEQFVEIGGVRYSHVVDPRTGLGVVGMHTVSVIAADGALADAVATAAGVLGPRWAGELRARLPGIVIALR